MLNVLTDLEKTRLEAEQVLAEGVARGFPFGVSYLAVRGLLIKRQVPIPADLLAWVSRGKARDCDVTNWDAPDGA